jgi:hypothetical protein
MHTVPCCHVLGVTPMPDIMVKLYTRLCPALPTLHEAYLAHDYND